MRLLDYEVSVTAPRRDSGMLLLLFVVHHYTIQICGTEAALGFDSDLMYGTIGSIIVGIYLLKTHRIIAESD